MQKYNFNFGQFLVTKLTIFIVLTTVHEKLIGVNAIDKQDVFSAMCDRIYFEHPIEDNFPFVNFLSGVYIKTTLVRNGFPVYRNERGGAYFYVKNNISRPLVFDSMLQQTNKVGFGFGLYSLLKKEVTEDPSRWIKTINNSTMPLGDVFSTPFIDWKSGVERKTPPVVKCVSNPMMTDCGDNPIILTTKVTFNNSIVVNSPVINNFNVIPNRIENNRRVYKHDNFNVTGYYLFYHSGHWIIGPDLSKGSGSFIAKSTAVKPEFVTSRWMKFDKRWVEINAQIQCRGSKNLSMEDCRRSCRNSACSSNSFNETICTCAYGYTGQYCRMKRISDNMCNDLQYQSEAIINREIGALAMEYCPGKKVRSLVCYNYKNKGLSWYGYRCPITTTTTTKQTTTLPTHSWGRSTTEEKINLDDDNTLSFVIIVLVIGLPLLFPLFHWCFYSVYKVATDKKSSNIFTICSIHAYFGMLFWILFLIVNYIFGIYKIGPSTFTFIIVAAILYAICGYIYVMIESLCCSSTMGYLKTNFDESNAENYVRSLIAKEPIVMTTAICYHFETRTRTTSYRDANGHTQHRTETYQERVNTWTGAHVFNFNFWKDNSDTNNIPLPKSGERLRIKLAKEVVFSNEETKLSFLEQKERFASENRHRDAHMDIATDYGIAQFKEHIMAYDPQSGIPSWMNIKCFVLSVLLCLSWPYRIFLQSTTKKRRFTILKEISVVPLETIIQQPSTLIVDNLYPQLSDGSDVKYPGNDIKSPSKTMPVNPHPQVSEVPPAYIEVIQMNEVANGNKNSGYVFDDVKL